METGQITSNLPANGLMGIDPLSTISSAPVHFSTASCITEQLDQRAEKLDKHVDELEEDIDYFNRTLKQQHALIESVENKTNANTTINIEQDKKIKTLEDKVDFLENYINYLEGRIMALEDKIK